MGQTGHGWLTRMVNAMTNHGMDTPSQELLHLARRKSNESNGTNLPQAALHEPLPKTEKPKGFQTRAKERLSVTLPVELLERLRNAVYWTPDLTIAGLIEQAVADSVDRLEQRHGEPFPPRIESLKRGRPRRVRSESSQG